MLSTKQIKAASNPELLELLKSESDKYVKELISDELRSRITNERKYNGELTS